MTTPTSNHVTHSSSREHLNCAGRACTRPGTINLKINYIDKKGIFCNQCSNDLLHLGLAEVLEIAIKEENDCPGDAILSG